MIHWILISCDFKGMMMIPNAIVFFPPLFNPITELKKSVRVCVCMGNTLENHMFN